MDIQKTFSDSLQNEVLSDAIIDVTESSIDALIGVARVGINIQDKLFLKKIIIFLRGIDDIDPIERKKMIESIDNSKKYRLKVGEKLLYILDSCNDYEGSERVSKLFKAFLAKEITYNEYLETAGVLAKLSSRELKIFLDTYEFHIMNEDAKELTYTGLVYSETEEISVDLKKITQDDWDDPEEHYEAEVSGGYTLTMPTAAGHIVYKVFGIDIKPYQK